MGYRSGILRLEFLAFFSAVRNDKKRKKGYLHIYICIYMYIYIVIPVSLLRFPIALPGFWHLMTGDIMNQTSEVLSFSGCSSEN